MKRLDKALQICRTPETAALLETAARAALESGFIIRQLYEKPHKIDFKGPIDLVTEADLAAEAAILAVLRDQYPHTPVLTEESAPSDGDAVRGPVWIVDPLDGTTNFAHGFPYFCVSISHVTDGRPDVGVIYCPLRNELFHAVRDGGGWLNEKRIRVTDTDQLLQALIGTGFPYDIHENLDDVMIQMKSVLPKVRDIRRAGAAALDLAYVACGRLDGFYEMRLKPWDMAAGLLLVTEAGGRVSDFGGKKFSLFGQEILATNGRLHEKLLALIT